jgi:hypothetical protein
VRFRRRSVEPIASTEIASTDRIARTEAVGSVDVAVPEIVSAPADPEPRRVLSEVDGNGVLHRFGVNPEWIEWAARHQTIGVGVRRPPRPDVLRPDGLETAMWPPRRDWRRYQV